MSRQRFRCLLITCLGMLLLSIEVGGEEIPSKLQHAPPMPNKTIETVLKEHTPRLMSLHGVVGVGQGECAGTPCIIVMVEELRHTLRDRIPTRIEGFDVTIKETGKINALDPQSTH